MASKKKKTATTDRWLKAVENVKKNQEGFVLRSPGGEETVKKKAPGKSVNAHPLTAALYPDIFYGMKKPSGAGWLYAAHRANKKKK